MEIQRKTIYWMLIISFFSLIAAWILDYEKLNFWSNIAIGMLSSALLGIIVSVIAYKVERRRTLEEFYSQALKAIRNISSYETSRDPVKTMELILQIGSYNYSELGDAYAKIDFFWGNKKKTTRIFNEIYSKIIKFRNVFLEKQYDFNGYLKGDITNLPVMEIFIQELEDKLVRRTSREIENVDGSNTTITNAEKNVMDIEKELNSWFYKLMYGKENPITDLRGNED
ncbi:hypothetical protein AB4114_23375 [Paenibacillus sp. 2RAB27]|uniref:hypothetical protein n=1 Tax=Paenibacillus sp. 2RAB27 TaxID=3232991 RepID=UPI003F9E7E3D